MKRKFLSLFLLLAVWTVAKAERLLVQTPHTSLVIEVSNKTQSRYVYYGPRLDERDVPHLLSAGGRTYIYPAFGTDIVRSSAFAMEHADGSLATELQYVSNETRDEGTSSVTTIHLKDKVYPVFVDVCYRAYKDVDVIETWTEITHEEKRTVTLTQFASARIPLRYDDIWISHLYGAWGNECRLVEEKLNPGRLVISNAAPIRNAQCEHPEVMFSLHGKPTEQTGDVIGAVLCYNGSYKLSVEMLNANHLYFTAGINEEYSAYHLRKGERFVTPPLALTYSQEGKGGVSRTFHRWGRNYKLCHGNQLRDVLLNSWEGVYLDIKQPEMAQMMQDIADMGGELFVMDDGWFGRKYRRDVDNAALGDWIVDERKLPDGIEGLVRTAKEKKVKFGIWIEPEMANKASELYDQHPDWILNAPNRPLAMGRGGTQLVLDLTNPKVQDYVFGIVDNLLTRYPEIAYIKWDANMSIQSHGSNYLPKEDQSHLFIAYEQGLRKVCERIRAKYPDVGMQDCASGGARVNWGMLPYFDEFWTSDNTDAFQRIYMQWGTSHFFPAIAMASHISASPNHQTHRTLPLKYRIDVAMSGRLGMELQPRAMTEEERTQCRKAIADYKQIRPVVQLGDLYRLVSPYENKNFASLMYVSEAKDQAVFYWWKLRTFVDERMPRIRLQGLDPTRLYKLHELNRIDKRAMMLEGKVFTGAYLMQRGIDMPGSHDIDNRTDWASRVLYLEAQ